MTLSSHLKKESKMNNPGPHPKRSSNQSRQSPANMRRFCIDYARARTRPPEQVCESRYHFCLAMTDAADQHRK